jgi:hypothetical protein
MLTSTIVEGDRMDAVDVNHREIVGKSGLGIGTGLADSMTQLNTESKFLEGSMFKEDAGPFLQALSIEKL